VNAVPLYSRTLRGSVGSVGEVALIRSIRGWLGRASPGSPRGIGDDCAVLRPARGRELITVDPVIHDVHFDNRIPPRAVGAKLLKRNLSDIAAMGGRPRAAVVALAMDAKISLVWLAEFHRGLARASRRYGVEIVGGDVAWLPGSFAATLTLVGEADGRILKRSGSRAGDWIYVTGSLGRSLETGHHHSFEPRLREGAWLAGRREVRAMTDISDGLAKDLGSLTPLGAEPALFEAVIPRRGAASVAEALCGGEDYELLFSVAQGGARAPLESSFSGAFPRTRLTCIGRFVRAGSVPPDALNIAGFHGYEHLR
jgi:thiamine-monophosphate kinase